MAQSGTRRLYGPTTVSYGILDLSGGVQTATSRLLKKANEVGGGTKNAVFNQKIGSAARRPGYEQVGRTIQGGNDGLGATAYKYSGNNKIDVGINNSAGTNATVQYLDVADYWNTIISNADANTRFSFLNYLDELYVAGYSPSYDSYLTLQNIDSTLVASSSRNVLNAPKSRFIAEYQGSLYAINVQVGGVKYKDRAYKSSPPLGAITFVQGDQVGLLQQLAVDSVRYLKPGMVVDIYGAGTEAKKTAGLTIVSVNKSTNVITFAATSINLSDNDEIWLQNRKGKLSIFWNTDYPNPEASDFLRVPPGKDDNPEFTGWGKNNNRLLLFTRNSILKWDGANFIPISDSVGCVAHETIQNIGNWTLWLHYTGVWGYNDSTGQLRLFSRSVDNFIKAINQTNFPKASAIVVGKMYKLAVGQIATLDSVTTSTSTSSTSTSSTSSSTSSTSTSSTSTSSTSSSTSISSTSTSSTSFSTSSTSTSSTSTSISTSSTSTSYSTSSTSTSTTTVSGGRSILRLVYDFDMNAWWPEYHTREIRYQFNHTMSGYTKPYFIDDTGRLFRDETGDLDLTDTIPFVLETGRTSLGSNFVKKLSKVKVYSERARGAQISVAIDGGQFLNIGQVTQPVETIVIPFDTPEGVDFNFQVTHNDPGEAPIVDGIAPFYSSQEVASGST